METEVFYPDYDDVAFYKDFFNISLSGLYPEIVDDLVYYKRWRDMLSIAEQVKAAELIRLVCEEQKES